jgi:hypothetical protein
MMDAWLDTQNAWNPSGNGSISSQRTTLAALTITMNRILVSWIGSVDLFFQQLVVSRMPKIDNDCGEKNVPSGRRRSQTAATASK